MLPGTTRCGCGQRSAMWISQTRTDGRSETASSRPYATWGPNTHRGRTCVSRARANKEQPGEPSGGPARAGGVAGQQGAASPQAGKSSARRVDGLLRLVSPPGRRRQQEARAWTRSSAPEAGSRPYVRARHHERRRQAVRCRKAEGALASRVGRRPTRSQAPSIGGPSGGRRSLRRPAAGTTRSRRVPGCAPHGQAGTRLTPTFVGPCWSASTRHAMRRPGRGRWRPPKPPRRARRGR